MPYIGRFVYHVGDNAATLLQLNGAPVLCVVTHTKSSYTNEFRHDLLQFQGSTVALLTGNV